jgi:membrane-associated phospholipid phosphatase
VKKIIWGSLLAVFIVLCFIFNKYDLNISIYLTQFDNSFYEFFDDYGELPIYIGPILFGAIYSRFASKKRNKILISLVTFIAYAIACIKIIHNKDWNYNLVSISVAILVSIILCGITLIGFSKISKEKLEKIKDLALLGLLVSIVSYGCTEIVKYTWGRVRFRDLSSDYNEFTNLFKINWFTGHKSFPSGHTNAATSILLISMIVARLINNKIIKNLTVIGCFLYIFTVAFSRIVVSAHYASDVLVGFAIGFTTIVAIYNVLKRKGVINASNR